jgi:hypothetical protein
VAGLLMTRNLAREVSRARNIRRFGVAAVAEFRRPIRSFYRVPRGLDLPIYDSKSCVSTTR